MVSLDVLLYIVYGLSGEAIDHEAQPRLFVGEWNDLQSYLSGESEELWLSAIKFIRE